MILLLRGYCNSGPLLLWQETVEGSTLTSFTNHGLSITLTHYQPLFRSSVLCTWLLGACQRVSMLSAPMQGQGQELEVSPLRKLGLGHGPTK